MARSARAKTRKAAAAKKSNQKKVNSNKQKETVQKIAVKVIPTRSGNAEQTRPSRTTTRSSSEKSSGLNSKTDAKLTKKRVREASVEEPVQTPPVSRFTRKGRSNSTATPPSSTIITVRSPPAKKNRMRSAQRGSTEPPKPKQASKKFKQQQTPIQEISQPVTRGKSPKSTTRSSAAAASRLKAAVPSTPTPASRKRSVTRQMSPKASPIKSTSPPPGQKGQKRKKSPVKRNNRAPVAVVSSRAKASPAKRSRSVGKANAGSATAAGSGRTRPARSPRAKKTPLKLSDETVKPPIRGRRSTQRSAEGSSKTTTGTLRAGAAVGEAGTAESEAANSLPSSITRARRTLQRGKAGQRTNQSTELEMPENEAPTPAEGKEGELQQEEESEPASGEQQEQEQTDGQNEEETKAVNPPADQAEQDSDLPEPEAKIEEKDESDGKRKLESDISSSAPTKKAKLDEEEPPAEVGKDDEEPMEVDEVEGKSEEKGSDPVPEKQEAMAVEPEAEKPKETPSSEPEKVEENAKSEEEVNVDEVEDGDKVSEVKESEQVEAKKEDVEVKTGDAEKVEKEEEEEEDVVVTDETATTVEPATTDKVEDSEKPADNAVVADNDKEATSSQPEPIDLDNKKTVNDVDGTHGNGLPEEEEDHEKLVRKETEDAEAKESTVASAPTTNGVNEDSSGKETTRNNSSSSCRKFARNAHLSNDAAVDGKFSLVSYNLHELDGSPEQHDALIGEIEDLAADILCLQDVDARYFSDTLEPSLKNRGYSGIFHKGKSGEFGLATMSKTNAFELVSHKGCDVLELVRKDVDSTSLEESEKTALLAFLLKSSSVLYAKLKFVAAEKNVCICNASLPADDHSLHALQLAVMVRELTSQSEGSGNPHLLCGTFNLEETHPGFQVLKDGYLSSEMIEDLQGRKNVPIPEKENAALVNLLWKCFQHPSSSLKSSYNVVLGDELTQVSKQRLSVRDSLWFSSDSLHVAGVLDLDPADKAATTTSPCTKHVSLKADLIFAN